MCAGIGSPGTLAEVLRGYRGDRKVPQLIAGEETIQEALSELKSATPLGFSLAENIENIK